MGIHEAIFTRLQAVSGVTDLVSTRVYRDRAPEPPTAPFIVFEIDDDEENAHAMGVDASVRRAYARFYCLATTGDAASALAVALIAALRRYSGTSSSVVVDDCYLRGDRQADEEDVKLRGRLVEFELCYQA